ncbi:elongation of very long chain fatty acids protein AAEL008004-like [Eupeodes corollae]|uniref:elongation of very long chain fatty acids protein AAEL008004-like n=1 Tax=Eupeodes corollae TaxID=290404 RepID=UPI0024932A6A|nr:elongation of very long chain fatty acids protein AAEL008004-like [Eupeodes corollae]
MALILKYFYFWISYWFNEHKDPRVEGFFLLGSPFPMYLMIILYLAFVLKWGPKWMENRKPYDLKNVIRVYNFLQVVSNLWLFIFGIRNSYFRKEFSMFCQPIDTTNNKPWMQNLLLATYGYYITKYVDLLDTVFFVLRKKNNQITFLHVYHHAGMVFAVYIFTKFLAGSHSTMLGVINLFVHTIMYSYYLLSSINPKYTKSIWWKRYITQLQLVQFGYLVFHFIIVIVKNDCGHPNLIAFVGLIQNLFMFALFFDFYRRSYIRKRTKVQ